MALPQTSPPAPKRNPIALWFQIGGAIFAGMGCLVVGGALVLLIGVNLAMPSDTPPANTDATGQDVYAVVTAPFRAFRWLIDQLSPLMVIIGLGPLVLGVLFLLVSRGIAGHRRWARYAGAVLLLVPVAFGTLAMLGGILEHAYDEAAYMLPFVLVPLYPFWLLIRRWE